MVYVDLDLLDGVAGQPGCIDVLGVQTAFQNVESEEEVGMVGLLLLEEGHEVMAERDHVLVPFENAGEVSTLLPVLT